jgi:lipopolysaccharide export system protein LptA
MIRLCRPCVLLVIAVAMADAAVAQGRPGAPAAAAPTMMQGLTQGQSSNQPVQIEAATLVVREKSKIATFSGNVQVVQGDTTMKCQSLVVFYDTDNKGGNTPATAVKPSPGMPEGAQSIRRIEARGGVTVVTKDQNAQGDLGVFDMKANTITLSGNVVVSQGQNVMRGERVVVDMTTGVSRVESGGKVGQNRVRALIQPGKGDTPGGPPKILPVGPSKVN